LALKEIDLGIEGEKFDGDYLMLSQLGGLHMNVPDLLTAMPQKSAKDFEDMIARLEKVPELANQHEALLREGLRRKATPPKLLLEKIPPQFKTVLTDDPEKSPLFESFREIKSDLSAGKQAEIRAKALDVIRLKVYPALQGFRDFVVGEYIPNARSGISWSEMPNGKAWYAFNVKRETTTTKTPDELHKLGLSEVARIKSEMESVREHVKFKGDLKKFNQFLLTDSQFYFETSEELMMAYRDFAKRVDPELPKLFGRLPRLTYGVREMAAYKAASAPTAYYQSGSPESGRPGYFEANTYDLKTRPKWGIEALTIHEAVPGHHLQISLAQEIEGLPGFRKNSFYTAYVEGWGLYAESLGTDMGFYKDPYSRYGQLSYEIWRAVRLVVDTGMHDKAWTRQQAIDYFMEAMPKSQLESEVEVDRYLTWPGQALAYKVGQLKFSELRQKAKDRLGDRFSIRDFHDEVLRHGAVPLDVLEKMFDEWLQKKSSEKPAKKKLS
jgi:uncharacterized protein (DUF885 family)